MTMQAISIAQRWVASLVRRYKDSPFREEHEWWLVALPMRVREKNS